jgi:hypothetical protein
MAFPFKASPSNRVIAFCQTRHDIRLSAVVSVLSSGFSDRRRVKYNLIAIAVGALAAGAGLGAGGAYVVLNHTASTQPVVSVPPASPVEITPSAPVVESPQPPATALAQSGDAQRALDGVQKQQFLPLQTISATVREKFPGEIVSAKLDEDDGVVKYELKILTVNGRILEIDVDPRSGKIVNIDEDD